MVKLKYCDKCACDMPTHFRKCPSCGALNRQRFWSKWWVKGVVFTLFLAAFYYVVETDWSMLGMIDRIKDLI